MSEFKSCGANVVGPYRCTGYAVAAERDAAIRERDEARQILDMIGERLRELNIATEHTPPVSYDDAIAVYWATTQQRVLVLERMVDNLASLVCAGSEDAMDFCYHCGAERIGCGDKCVETLKAWALSHSEKEPA